MQVAIVIYDGVTGAEAVGPYEVFRRSPDLQVRFVARRAGPHTVHGRPSVLVADRTLAECERPDVVVVPGGFGIRRLTRDRALVDWVATAHDTTQWTTAVSTGSLVLAAAGVLDGQEATSHWLALDDLEALGAVPRGDRLVARGRVVTASGGAGGVELADHVVRRTAGPEVADAVQRSMALDAHRPFGATPSALTAPVRRLLSIRPIGGRYVSEEDEDERVPRWRRHRSRPRVAAR